MIYADTRSTRMRFCTACLAAALISLSSPARADDEAFAGTVNRVVNDHLNFYSLNNLCKFAGGLAVGGILANTSLDEDINEWYQESVRSPDTDDIAEVTKEFGNGVYTIPLYAGACAAGLLLEYDMTFEVVGEWGERSLRTMILGAPVVLVFQRALGGARPTDEDDSTWRPFKDNNGISGHAFMGAVPFISAAKMTDNLGIKSVLYFTSTLSGFSRVNDEDHYFSQSLLGWWLAYLAASSVDNTEYDARRWNAGPILIDGHPGMGITLAF